MPRARSTRCTFKENGRRCPRDGIGEPPLCTLCRMAVAAASLPQSPGKVLAENLLGFLAGRPIDAQAAVTAAQDVYGQWSGGGPNLPGAGPQPPRSPPWAPPPVDHEAEELRRAQVEARSVLGFGPTDKLTEPVVKDRQRKLARKYHPDLAGGDARKQAAFTKRMASINAAADVLLQSL